MKLPRPRLVGGCGQFFLMRIYNQRSADMNLELKFIPYVFSGKLEVEKLKLFRIYNVLEKQKYKLSLEGCPFKLALQYSHRKDSVEHKLSIQNSRPQKEIRYHE